MTFKYHNLLCTNVGLLRRKYGAGEVTDKLTWIRHQTGLEELKVNLVYPGALELVSREIQEENTGLSEDQGDSSESPVGRFVCVCVFVFTLGCCACSSLDSRARFGQFLCFPRQDWRVPKFGILQLSLWCFLIYYWD